MSFCLLYQVSEIIEPAVARQPCRRIYPQNNQPWCCPGDPLCLAKPRLRQSRRKGRSALFDSKILASTEGFPAKLCESEPCRLPLLLLPFLATSDSLHRGRPPIRHSVDPGLVIQPHDLVLDTPNEAILQACFTGGILRLPGLFEHARLTARHNGKVVELMITLVQRELSRTEEVPDCQKRALDVVLICLLP